MYKKSPSVIKTEGDSKGINIAGTMLIHFCSIVLTNCAMCLMLNIAVSFIYRCKYLMAIKVNVFIVMLKSFVYELSIYFFAIVKLNY